MLTAFVILLAGALSISAQNITMPDWENAVLLEVLSSQDAARPGDELEIALVAEIVPGYHLYGPEEPYPSGTSLEVQADSLELGEPEFPAPIRRELSGLGEYNLYEGQLTVKIPVSVPEDAGATDHRATLTVSYQICTDYACSAPTSEELSVELPVAAKGDAVKSLHPDIFEKK